MRTHLVQIHIMFEISFVGDKLERDRSLVHIQQYIFLLFDNTCLYFYEVDAIIIYSFEKTNNRIKLKKQCTEIH